MIKRLALWASFVSGACGDNLVQPRTDATMSVDVPAVPTIGMQIDRIGRPLVNTALNGLLDPAANVAAKKDAFNQASTPAAWPATEVSAGRTILTEVAANLAVLDVVDKGLANVPAGGCGNNPLYERPPSAPHT